MKQMLHGYLYGHYDSRGGSAFVCTKDPNAGLTVREADTKYLEFFWPGENPEEFRDCIEEDYLGPAWLDLNDNPMPAFQEDIGEHTYDTKGIRKQGDGSPDFLVGRKRYDLVLVRDGQTPPRRAGRPRWDDDAFGLIIVYVEDVPGYVADALAHRNG